MTKFRNFAFGRSIYTMQNWSRSAELTSILRTTGVAFALWLLPSLGLMAKLLSTLESAALGSCAFILIFLLLFNLDKLYPESGNREAAPARILVLLLVIAFIVLFPLAKSGLYGGGSDRDDALNVTLRALLHGEYPYYTKTYLGNPPTPMPGAMLLALPAYLLGSSALQNLFWVPFFVLRGELYFNSAKLAFVYGTIFILFCPASLQDFVSGGDYLVNCLYVITSMALILRSCPGGTSRKCRVALYAFHAICISSRPIFIMVLPAVAAFLHQRSGYRRVIEYVAATGFFLGVLNLPFFLYDPAHFPAFNLSRKLSDLPMSFHAGVVVPLLSAVVACASFAVKMSRSRVYGVVALSFAPMFFPLYIVQILTRGATISVLLGFGFSLPVTLFGGMWLLNAWGSKILSREPADAALPSVPNSAGRGA